MKALDLKAIFHKELDNIYGVNEVDSFFFLCLEHYLNVPRFQLALEPEFSLTKNETKLFFNTLNQLKKQKPIQYILGKTEFYGLPFNVNEYVLIPRPETEELVDWIIRNNLEENNKSQLNILDIGTGSGCIAISLAKHLQSAKVFAVDVSEAAINVAKENARLNNVAIEFLIVDILNRHTWSSDFKNLEFDIIVSNPPYVRNLEKEDMKPNVLDNEPHLALFVDNQNPLIFYKAIVNFAVNNLKHNGQLYFEINQYLGEETKQLMIDADLNNIELRVDINSNNRMLKGIKN